ncbi:MAG TPA: AraC family transcriptional regulator [Steroidobacteraceae bacterium]|nr:AraC family transcriptional regulator [Steroidobacteraceae bacterium]
MDALSDVLQAVRLTGTIFFDVQATAPWVAQTPPGPSVVDAIFPGSKHLISYHVLTHGSCWMEMENREPLLLSAGDIIVFPHGNPHSMSSVPGMRSTANMKLYRRAKGVTLPATIMIGDSEGGPADAKFICGFLGCDARPFNPLLDALPRVIHMSERDVASIGFYARLAVEESNQSRIGGQGMLGRISELMFVDVVRRYLETLPVGHTTWLAGLRDPIVGKAISALHTKPARNWTLESLAREVALSRSALAERFTEFVGTPPMQYLTNWRMQLAATRLQAGSESIATVANHVGYESEAAFSRVFKKIVGVPPSEWRKRRAPAA